ncbi:Holliday junction branch migration protein RuvA [Paracrocinitomix mangrovi]|uniref:Holliday junction branch migration protein RuvA n=1 Tax=Paracrocinitomix mangrovi TaxID=2862509 RepID=UPI001C8F1437|nr:Holliday junction branch migration protein RuvA [Paracrocinitomix mangrovi]UKN00887.1 Holliday junction branch migration protein RuvA [Paracrocinitomix mangrovi]
MIAHLNGRLVEKTPTYIVVECGGVGYLVKISLNTFSLLGSDENIKIHTQLMVREDAHTLYGFAHLSEREMFNHLISVSGIGANTAILMLSAMTSDEIASAIVGGDVATIQGIKGIGAKTAQRVIIDLKDKVAKSDLAAENILFSNNTNQNDALTALLALGFDKKRAEKAINKVLTDEQSVEEIIKEALKVL